jgi:hypothetical protein
MWKTVMSRLKATILCIDDHWNGLIGRKMLLEGNGYQVLETTGGDAGLKLFLSHSVDAVVLDYQMPGMNGANWRWWTPSCQNPSRQDSLIHGSGSAQQPARPFFSRWFDTWRSRNEGARQ